VVPLGSTNSEISAASSFEEILFSPQEADANNGSQISKSHFIDNNVYAHFVGQLGDSSGQIRYFSNGSPITEGSWSQDFVGSIEVINYTIPKVVREYANDLNEDELERFLFVSIDAQDGQPYLRRGERTVAGSVLRQTWYSTAVVEQIKARTDEIFKGVVTNDGDSIDAELDNCPTVANEDQLDSDENGIGDACELSFNTSGLWRWEWQSRQGNTEYDSGEDACVLEEAPFSGSYISYLNQEGSFLQWSWWNDSLDSLTWNDWSGRGEIDEFGSFTIPFDDQANYVISGDINTNSMLGTALESETSISENESTSCLSQWDLVASRSTPADARPIGIEGLVWFDSDYYSYYDNETNQVKVIYEFEYGVLSEEPELIYSWNKNQNTWTQLQEENTYINDSEIVQTDLVAISDYASDGSYATFTVSSLGQTYSAFNLQLQEVSLEGTRMKSVLPTGYEDQLTKGPRFETGAFMYEATLTRTMTSYDTWCDDDWHSWFATNLDCDNAVPLDPSSDEIFAASSFENILLTLSEANTIGGDYDGRHLFIDQGVDAQFIGESLDESGEIRYHNNNEELIATGSWVRQVVNSTEIITFEIPESVQSHAPDLDDEDLSQFLFVTIDTADGLPYLRRGEITKAGTVERFSLYNMEALNQVKVNFTLFGQALNNGIDFDINILAGRGFFSEDWIEQCQCVEPPADGDETIVYLFDENSDTGLYTSEFEAEDTDQEVSFADIPMTWSLGSDKVLNINIPSLNEVHRYALLNITGEKYSLIADDGVIQEFDLLQNVDEIFSNSEFTKTDFLPGDYVISGDDWGYRFLNGGTGYELDCYNGCSPDGDIVWSFDSIEKVITVDWETDNIGADQDKIIWDGTKFDGVWIPSLTIGNRNLGVHYQGSFDYSTP